MLRRPLLPQAQDLLRQGLLPDYYLLRPQISYGPAINPGTVQADAIRFFNKPALYDFRALRQSGLLIRATDRDVPDTFDTGSLAHRSADTSIER